MLDYNEYDKIIYDCKKLSEEKNKLYGNESLRLFKGYAILSRMNDKIMRINNMFENNIKNKEGLKDSIMDLINYSIYLLMLKKGKI